MVKSERQQLDQATHLTHQSLEQFIATTLPQDGRESQLSIAEQTELLRMVSTILPAGNVAGFVLNGIANTKNRRSRATEGRAHINSLFKGLGFIKDNAFYHAMYIGPATVLAGYNMLLQLAGASWRDFLPDGAWQFYVEFGLREDTARHQTETRAFNRQIMKQPASEVEQLSAWIMAAMWLIHDYERWLALHWEENVRLTTLARMIGKTDLHQQWRNQAPYGLPANAAGSFVDYRYRTFEVFFNDLLKQLSSTHQQAFKRIWADNASVKHRQQYQQAYCNQLTIRSYLEPGEHSDMRVPNTAPKIGIVHKQNYYLLNAIYPSLSASPQIIYSQASSILHHAAGNADIDELLICVPRGLQQEARKKLGKTQQNILRKLQNMAVLINWDTELTDQPLTALRQRHRGVGDHPLTVFRADKSTVFDFSHIYFDGPWAIAVAEVMTNVAGYFLRHMPAALTISGQNLEPLDLATSASTKELLLPYVKKNIVVSAEASISIKPLRELRSLLLKRTSDRVNLTINDLLVLYRTIFNQRYQPGLAMQAVLSDLKRQNRDLADRIQLDIDARRMVNPSLLIPIDATVSNPRDRLFPSIFRSPVNQVSELHQEAYNRLQIVSRKRFLKQSAHESFGDARKQYLGTLSTFGEVMRRYRKLAMEGESMSTTAIRLICGLPEAMQELLDGLPCHFDFMNEAIKGEEVFSNVGQVTRGSSIARFVSAKDDNEKKTLVWGIMTDDKDRLYITLRDYRPICVSMIESGFSDFAVIVTQDFLDGYMSGLSQFVEELFAIIAAPKT